MLNNTIFRSVAVRFIGLAMTVAALGGGVAVGVTAGSLPGAEAAETETNLCEVFCQSGTGSIGSVDGQ